MTKTEFANKGVWLVPLAVLALLLLAGWVGLHQPLMEIHGNWADYYGHFAHGYLVLAVAIWLAYRAWRSRPALRLSPCWLALPVLVALIAVLLLSLRLQVTTVNQSIVPLIMLTALGCAFGMQVVRLLFWPFAYLYFALPLWWVINTPLQDLTIYVAMLAVRIAGLQVHVDGSLFEMPAGVLRIASGCSGLNYLITGMAIAFLQGFLFLKTWSGRMKLLAFTAALMLVMNWIRVITIVFVGYYTDMQHYLIRVDHLTFGWVLFLLALWPIYWYGFRLERAEKSPVTESGSPPATGLISIEPAQVIAGGVIAALILLAPLCARLNM